MDLYYEEAAKEGTNTVFRFSSVFPNQIQMGVCALLTVILKDAAAQVPLLSVRAQRGSSA